MTRYDHGKLRFPCLADGKGQDRGILRQGAGGRSRPPWQAGGLNTDKGSQFTGAEASLGGEQDDHSIAEMVPGAGSKNQEVVDVANGEYFCLLASALR